METVNKPRLLVVDIETKPALAYIWRMWDPVTSIDMVKEPYGILCFAAKWVGEKQVTFYSEWEHGQALMMERLHELLSQSDAVITYNGDKFDLPRIKGEIVLQGLPPLKPLTSIDMVKTVKKLGYISAKLGFVGPHLGLGRKVDHEGFELWTKVLEGDEKARKKMTQYNIQDVVLLEKVYEKVKPHMANHPHLGDRTGEQCGTCGSHRVQSRGWRRTKSFRIRNLQCTDCGSWSSGTRQKIG